MRNPTHYLYLFLTAMFLNCGESNNEQKDGFKYEQNTNAKAAGSNAPPSASNTVDLSNKGIGPITSLKLSDTIDLEMAKKGEAVFFKMCAACHRPDKKFIGPAPKGILSKRSPEWIMNMILNPEEMLRKDPIAKQLLIEYNYAPMIQQDLTPDDARAILEYYRTLD